MADFDLAIIGGGLNGVSVARHADAVQPAADDRQIVVRHARLPV